MAANRPISVIVVIAALVLALDQVSKAMIVAAMGPAHPAMPIDLFGGWFLLEYVENRGVAFGLFAGAGPMLLIAAALTLLVLGWHVMRSPQQPHFQLVAFGLILGGALGNVLDRFRLGHVIDFISVGWWPNFNLADCAISVGVALMLLGWIIPGKHTFYVSRH